MTGASVTRPHVRWFRVFSSAVDARRLRRPTDVLLLVLGTLALVPLTLLGPGPTRIDTAVSDVLRELSGAWDLLWSAAYAVLGLWALLLVLNVLVSRGRRRLVLDLLLAGGLAVGIAVVVGRMAGTPPMSSLSALVSTDATEVFVASRFALVTAVVVAASPYLARPLRVVGRCVLGVGAVSGIALGVTYPIGAAGAFAVGVVAGAATHLLRGSPDSRLTARQVTEALAGMGMTVTDVDPFVMSTAGTAQYHALSSDGRRLLVEVYGRDAWDNQFLASIWTSLVRRGEHPHLGRTRTGQAEHAALATLLAQQGAVPAPRVVAVGTTVEGDAVLVTEVIGVPLASVPEDAVDDVDLTSGWRALEHLHAVGIAHGRIDSQRVVVLDDGTLALTDLARAELAATTDERTADQVRLLVTTAIVAGQERAVAAAVAVLTPDGMVAVLPYLQTAALDRSTSRAVRAGGWDLEVLRSAAAGAAGVDPPPLEKLRRVTLRSAALAVAGTLIALALVSKLLDVDYASIADELSDANWWWLGAALLLAPTVQLATSFSTLGASAKPLYYGPVLMFQYAVEFLAVAIPSSAARLALEVRFFQSFGVAAAVALSIGLIDSVSGFVVQVLFLALIGLTELPGITAPLTGGSGTSASSTDGGSLVTLLVILGVVALIAVVTTFAVPSSRRRVISFVPRAKAMIRSQAASVQEALVVLRQPSKIGQLLGGNLVAQLIQAGMLGLCLQAFGVSVHLSQLILVNVLVSLFAGLMPVPGGIGITEFAYIAGLQAVGVPSVVAVSASIAYRCVSFYLPALWGSVAMGWLRRHGYA